MPTLAIVQCGQKKVWDKDLRTGRTPAKDAYISPYFKKNRAYAERFADRWVILSAKYGFLSPDEKIQNYNVTFSMPATNSISDNRLRRQVQRMKLGNFKEIFVIGGAGYAAKIEQAFEGTSCRILRPFKKYKGIGYIQQAVTRALKRGKPLNSDKL